ncbi:MAG: hypothetical protein JXA97_09230 [Anaerolineales bacterium]|nr:hypothetical protein [Anaerolineales bacterium]
MKIHARRVVLILLSLMSCLAPIHAAHAQASTAVTTRIDYRFGEELTFQAEISTDRPVLRATVFFRASNAPSTTYAFAEFVDEDGAYAEAKIDLSESDFPPFAEILYWWQLDFSETESYSTDTAVFTYRDNRISWQFLQQEQITVFWSEAGVEYGQMAMDIARQALVDIAQDLALPMPSSLAIYLYPSTNELQSALTLTGRRWVAGQSLPELGVVLLALPASSEAVIALERSLPHEITHVLLYERMGASYANLPGWLNEGLAVMQEQDPDPLYTVTLEQASGENRLLSIQSLCAGFPYESDTAMLAYAQSHAFVQYLRDIYGVGGIVRLLDAYQEGTTCEGGVQRVFMRSHDQLQSEWLNSSISAPQSPSSSQSLLIWILLLLPSGLGLFIAIMVRSSNRYLSRKE